MIGWNYRRQRVVEMADYRVYSIGNDGHAFEAILLDCPDDKAAIESAKQLINDHDIELWQRDRRIAKFERRPEQLR
jgi:hypothetical protein